MAAIAMPRPPIPSRPNNLARSSSPHPLTSTLSFDSINTAASCSVPILNRHLPVGSPVPVPALSENPDTPPQSPQTKETSLPPPQPQPPPLRSRQSRQQQSSILYPPNAYNSCSLGLWLVYEITPSRLAAALDHLSAQPLPDASQVFPWFHGLNPNNQLQQAFFLARRRNLRKTPKCLRGITIVKADGDLSCSRLKGAIAAGEFLIHASSNGDSSSGALFREVDPEDGLSIRNFHIQTAKTAMISDIVIYGDDEVEVQRVARDVAVAQQAWRQLHQDRGHDLLHYNTFICTTPFDVFEDQFPALVAIDSNGRTTGKIIDFLQRERMEMCTMTQASEIVKNVWLGPTPDPAVDSVLNGGDQKFDVFIECSDLGRLNPMALRDIAQDLDQDESVHLDFPSSGTIMPPSCSQYEADDILETCRWLYHLSHGLLPSTSPDEHVLDVDGDSQMSFASPPHNIKVRERKILIHCTDGYTESSLLALSYFTYATGLPVPTAWLDLHVAKGRNFFAYPSDVTLLTTIAPRLLVESPANTERSLTDITQLAREEPEWIKNMDGSLPSRITNYMYLGNLGHANNLDLLRQMGIQQLLSVGETASWTDCQLEQWGRENVMLIQRVQDNGVDPLIDEFERCLAFIDRGRANKTATLVHCRVGVSRSATICIAEVMRTLKLSFPRAYCYVRARRLNVIIQPHLRFSYELLKWEEKLRRESDYTRRFKRELEWPEIAREIAAMNRPYLR